MSGRRIPLFFLAAPLIAEQVARTMALKGICSFFPYNLENHHQTIEFGQQQQPSVIDSITRYLFKRKSYTEAAWVDLLLAHFGIVMLQQLSGLFESARTAIGQVG